MGNFDPFSVFMWRHKLKSFWYIFFTLKYQDTFKWGKIEFFDFLVGKINCNEHVRGRIRKNKNIKFLIYIEGIFFGKVDEFKLKGGDIVKVYAW